MTFLIAVPTGVKFFNWIGTMWKGSLSFETPMLWTTGFLITFVFGGLTGVILASPPMDFHLKGAVQMDAETNRAGRTASAHRLTCGRDRDRGPDQADVWRLPRGVALRL